MCKSCKCGKRDRGTQFSLAKKKPTIREKVGEPTPNGLGNDVTVAIKRQVSEVMKTPKEVITEYFRANDGALIETDVTAGGRRLFCIGKGTPIGAFVAFKLPKPLTAPKAPEGMVIGWSKRHPTDEPLVFTREDAKRVAITRGILNGVKLVDSAIEGDGVTVLSKLTASHNLPGEMRKSFTRFVDRVETYLNNKEEEG